MGCRGSNLEPDARLLSCLTRPSSRLEKFIHLGIIITQASTGPWAGGPSYSCLCFPVWEVGDGGLERPPPVEAISGWTGPRDRGPGKGPVGVGGGLQTGCGHWGSKRASQRGCRPARAVQSSTDGMSSSGEWTRLHSLAVIPAREARAGANLPGCWQPNCKRRAWGGRVWSDFFGLRCGCTGGWEGSRDPRFPGLDRSRVTRERLRALS